MFQSVSFTLSYHYWKGKHIHNHLDLFMDISKDELLVSYKAFTRQIKGKNIFDMFLNKPHRRRYMDFEGTIPNDMGKIRILLQGKLDLPKKLLNCSGYHNIITVTIQEKAIRCIG